jgi:hypothetical protein
MELALYFFGGLILVHIAAIPIARFHHWCAEKMGQKFNERTWNYEGKRNE